MSLICYENDELYQISNELFKRLLKEYKHEPKWIDGEAAMELLTITSDTTLQKYRDQERFRYSKIDPKVILYDRESILKYIASKANKPE